MSTQLFLFRHKLVDGIVAVATKRNRRLHLLAREILFEPFVAVAGSRNQVMLSRAFLWQPIAKRTLLNWFCHLKRQD
jgi:hypothetical protein